ncbi:MAG: CvfB family protein [Candidatus Cyclobacteriaceae bacterium M3_2C_046]
MEIGRFNKLVITRETPQGLYLNDNQEEVLLPNKYIPENYTIGQEIEVFVYKDSEDRLIATTLHPKAQLDQFAFLEVVDVNQHGAFLDWGLEKDLFVPYKEQKQRMDIGKKYLVRLCLDHRTSRMIGVNRIEPFLKKPQGELEVGQPVEVMVFDESPLGFKIMIDQQFEGLLYHNEIFEPLAIGDVKTGFIKNIREDLKIDVSLQKPGFESVADFKAILIEKLKQNDGFLPYHDKSSAELIKQKLNMSKKSFKKAVGGLYKEEKIVLEPGGIRLNQ